MTKGEAIRLGWAPFEQSGAPDVPRVRTRRYTQGRWWEVTSTDEETLLRKIEATELEIEQRRAASRKPPRVGSKR